MPCHDAQAHLHEHLGREANEAQLAVHAQVFKLHQLPVSRLVHLEEHLVEHGGQPEPQHMLHLIIPHVLTMSRLTPAYMFLSDDERGGGHNLP